MEQVEDLSIEAQEETFQQILEVNTQFKEQQRIIAILEALAAGETPQEPQPLALAYQNIESSGRFGIFFDADVTGL